MNLPRTDGVTNVAQKHSQWRYQLIFLGLLLISLILVSPPAQAATTSKSITIESNVVNVRMGPGLSYDTMAQLKRGEKIHVIADKNDWYQVRLDNDKIGWVASWLLHNTEIGTSTNQKGTMHETIYAYLNPRRSSKKLGTLTAGDAVTIVYQQGGWSQVLFKKTVAWVPSSSITVDQTVANTQDVVDKTIQKMTVSSETANLRDTPSVSGTIAEKLKNGAQLTYLATHGNWYKVKSAKGTTGYIANWVVDLTNQAKQQKQITSIAEATIVLDPGHGGNDSGAISNKKTYEKKYTLKTAQAIAKRLRKAGARVILTRSSDRYVSLKARPKLAQKVKADAFISLHFDSSDKANNASGVTTYYYHKSRDLKLAKSINGALKTLPIKRRGVEFGNFQVIRTNKRPAVLLELGYINDNKDYRQIKSQAYRTKVAEAVYTGLASYFK
jgi:N-acetylmuramoyl-L-alanine amidase